MTRSLGLAALMALSGLWQASPAQAADASEVLRLAPKDAQLVVVMSNLSKLSDKVGSLQSAWALPPSMNTQNGLQMVKAQMGIRKGLNDQGAAMMIFPDLTLMGISHGDRGHGPANQPGPGQPGAPGMGRTTSKGSKPVLLVLPVSDYQQFLGNFQGNGQAKAGGMNNVDPNAGDADANANDDGNSNANQADQMGGAGQMGKADQNADNPALNGQDAAANGGGQGGGQGGGKGGAVTKLQMPGGQPGYVRKQGDYAVISPLKSLVQRYQPGGQAAAKSLMGQAGELGKNAMSKSDVVAYLNMAALAPTLKPMLNSALDQADKQMDQRQQMGASKQQTANQKAGLKLAGQLARAVVNDASSMVAGLDIDKSGLGLRVTTQFKPDSTAAKMFPGGQADLGSLLGQLPDKPFILAEAIDGKAIDLGYMVQQVLNRLPEDSSNPMVNMYRKQLPAFKKLNGYAAAWYATDAKKIQGTGILNLLYVMSFDGGADKFISQTKKAVKQLNGQEMPMGNAGQMTMTTSYTENALKLQGVSVDQYKVQMTLPAQMRQQMGPMLGVLLGNGLKYNGYIAAKGDKVVVTTTPNFSLITAGIKALGNDQGIGSGGELKSMRQSHLPKNLAGEAYISLSGIAKTANAYLQSMNKPTIQIPDDTPPLAFGLGATGGGVSWRMYLPNESVKTLVNQAQKMRAQMQGPRANRAPRRQGPGAPQ